MRTAPAGMSFWDWLYEDDSSKLSIAPLFEKTPSFPFLFTSAIACKTRVAIPPPEDIPNKRILEGLTPRWWTRYVYAKTTSLPAIVVLFCYGVKRRGDKDTFKRGITVMVKVKERYQGPLRKTLRVASTFAKSVACCVACLCHISRF